MKHNTIYIYIKTHNKTGMKYFGKTTKTNVDIYTGSGIKWNRHLEEHGNDVTTEVIAEFTDIEEATEFALKFSRDNDIVMSNEWANSIPECVDDKQNFSHVNRIGLNMPCNWDDESKQKHLDGSIKGGNRAKELGVGYHGVSEEQRKINGRKGVKALQELMQERYGCKSVFSVINNDEEIIKKKKDIFKSIKHQQKEKNSQYGTCWIKNNLLEMNKKIKKEELELYISLGWEKGRVIGWPSKKD